jgi:hypothetical protein
MKTYNGITLEFKVTGRDNYMSLSDLAQDLTIKSLIEILGTLKSLNKQMTIMNRLEKEGIEDNLYFDLLENCNGY